jgi:signal transduction histidine kinase
MAEIQAAAVLVPRPLRRLASLLAALVLVIWAVTSHHTFWPMWVWFGLTLPLTLVSTVRWVLARPEPHRRGPLAIAWALLLVLTGWQVVIWLMTGAGYFWPVWNLIVVALLFAARRLFSGPRERVLEERVGELTRTRAGAVDVQASELRRIERDLHDGAQARLVALSMQLGRAEDRLAGKGADAGDVELVRQARMEATAAISELRDLARGISPPVLADRGLEAAVQSLADRSGSHVSINAEIEHRPPPAVENAGYFVVAEALTNAAKHAPGAPVRVTMWHEHSELGIVVSDEGLGGADPAGSGLTGLRQRVEALDGWLEVRSAVGEGTTVRAILPCQ